MTSSLRQRSTRSPAADRARAWRNARHASVCDVLEPWAHGTVVRATSRPTYWDFNVVRVEEDPAMSVVELAAFADQALAGLAHRRVDFDLVNVAERLCPDFEAQDWKATRLLWMRHEGSMPPGSDIAVEELPYDAVYPWLSPGVGDDGIPSTSGGKLRIARRPTLRRARCSIVRFGLFLRGIRVVNRPSDALDQLSGVVSTSHVRGSDPLVEGDFALTLAA